MFFLIDMLFDARDVNSQRKLMWVKLVKDSMLH